VLIIVSLTGRLLVKPYIKNVLLSLIVIILLLSLTEGITRIICNQPLYVFDETLGYVTKPGSVTEKTETYEANYTINKLGYRGEPYDNLKKPGIFRIVLIGDSHGFGWGINDDETFATIIEKRLRNVEIINLSVSGYGTDQEFLRLKKEGLSYNPDLVIIQVCANDFTEIKRSSMYGRAKPFFILQQGTLTLKNVPVKSNCNSDQEVYVACLPFPYRDWLQKNSRAYQVLNYRFLKFKKRFNNILNKITGQRSSAADGNDNLSEIDDDALALFKAIIHKIHIELAAKDIKAIVIYWDEVLSKSGKIDDINLPVIDLYQDTLQNEKGILIPDDGHFNKYGHVLVAESLRKSLIRHNLLPENHR